LNLLPSDFYQQEHTLVFAAMKELWNSRKTIDVVTVSNELTKGDDLDVI